MEAKSIVEDAEFTPFLKRLTAFCAGGPFLDGYILVIIGVALTQLGPFLKLTPIWSGLIGAASLAGLFFGGLVFGYVTDMVGRKLMYTIDLITIIILSIAAMFITSPMQLLILRFLIGIAVGADYPIATSLLTEFSPKKHRAFMLGLTSVMWFVGASVADFVGYFLVDYPGSWRWMLGSAAIPALILVLGRWGTPESARWLYSKGRVDEALAVLKRVYGSAAQISDLGETKKTKYKFKELFSSSAYLKRTVFSGMFYLCLVGPLFAIYTFGPTILQAFGLAEGKQAILGDSLISVAFMLGCIPSMYLINSWGRRPQIIWSFALMTFGMLILGLYPTADTWVIIIGFTIYAIFSGGPNILCWIYPNELFPTEVRASAVGIVVAISRIGACLGTFALPILLKTFGIGPTMLMMTAMTFVGLVVCIVMAPETKGLSLTESSSITFKA